MAKQKPDYLVVAGCVAFLAYLWWNHQKVERQLSENERIQHQLEGGS